MPTSTKTRKTEPRYQPAARSQPQNGNSTATPQTYFTSPTIDVDGQQLTIRIRDITPDEATQLLADHNDVNRPFSTAVIQKLARDMRDDAFRVNGDTICFDLDGRVLDGQNRLRAIAESGLTQTIIEIAGLNPQVMDTKDLGKGRTVLDILSINGYTIKNATVVIGAASILMIGAKNLTKLGQDRKRVAAYVIENLERLEETALWAKDVSIRSDKVRIRTTNRHILSAAPLTALSIIMEDQGASRDDVRTYLTALGTGTIPPNLGVVTEKERYEIIDAARRWLRESYPLIREGGTQFPQLLRVMGTLIAVYNRLKMPQGDVLRQVRLRKFTDNHYDSAHFPKAGVHADH